MEQTITCILCPVGCRLKVVAEGGEIKSVEGNGCQRGMTYAKQECIAPTRLITAVIKANNRQTPLSVKTERPIPKSGIFACMKAIQEAEVVAPVRMGQVILANVNNTGVNVIATRALE